MSTPNPKRLARLETLLAFDQGLLLENEESQAKKRLAVLGVDEVGRGSLVGPVVAAALVIPPELETQTLHTLSDLDDSKAPHLNHQKRVALAESLKAMGYWGIGEASQAEIEAINISKASLLASHRAIEDLTKQFPHCPLEQCLVVMDGKFKIPGLSLDQRALIKGDKFSAAVAGASVIAKAYRDKMMIALSQEYPGYHWERNAGYPTPEHQQALQALGVTPLHRKTYKAVQAAMGIQQVLLPL